MMRWGDHKKALEIGHLYIQPLYIDLQSVYFCPVSELIWISVYKDVLSQVQVKNNAFLLRELISYNNISGN